MPEQKYHPGFVSRSMARGMAATARLADAAMQKASAVTGEMFCPWMELNSYDSATGFYSWTEVTQDTDGTPYHKPNGLSGTPTYRPAVEMNGGVISTFPHYVRASLVISDDAVGEYYHFESTPTTIARFVRFALTSTLTTSDPLKASCTVDGYWWGTDPGVSITVYNLPSSSGYIFFGANGNKGLATYDDVLGRYWIVQIQC